MTEATRISLKLNLSGLLAIAVGVLAIYWPGGVVGALAFLASFPVMAFVVLTDCGFGKLGRRLSALRAVDIQTAREEFYRRYPWLRRG